MGLLPRLTIPKTVSISNPRINFVYYVLMSGVIAFSIWNFIWKNQYDKVIRVETRTSLEVQGQSGPNVISLNITASPLCPPAMRYGVAAPQPDPAAVALQPATWIEGVQALYQVSSTCLPVCSSGSTGGEDRSTCVSALTFAHHRSSDELSLWSARHILRNDGPYVDTFLGLSVLGTIFRVKYKYELERAKPWLFTFTQAQESSRLQDETMSRTVVLDRERKPKSGMSFSPGSDVILSLQDMLDVVQGFPSHLLGSSQQVPWEVFRDGVELSVHTECYNENGLLQEAIEGQSLSISQEPLCLLEVTYARCCTDFAGRVQQASGNIVVDRGLVMRTRTGISLMRFSDISSIVAGLTTVIVLMQIPMKFMRWFITNFLGQLSRLYNRVLNQVFDIQKQTATMAILLMANSVAFLTLSDMQDQESSHPGISRARMEERMAQVLRQRRSTLDEHEVAAFVDCCFQSLLLNKGDESHIDSQVSKWHKYFPWLANQMVTPPSPKTKHTSDMIDIDTFNVHCSYDSAVDLSTAVQLFDRDRRKGPVERIFTPRGLRTALTEVHRVSLHRQQTQPLAAVGVHPSYQSYGTSDMGALSSQVDAGFDESTMMDTPRSVDRDGSEPAMCRTPAPPEFARKSLSLEQHQEMKEMRLLRMSGAIEKLNRKIEDLEPRLQEEIKKKNSRIDEVLDLVTGVEKRLEERVLGHVQGLAQGRVAALEEALLASDEKACQDIAAINLTFTGLGQSLEALESKLKLTCSSLESKMNRKLATLEKKLEDVLQEQRLSHQETAGKLRDVAGNMAAAGPTPVAREAASPNYEAMVERLKFFEAELGQQKKGYAMLVSQLAGLDVQQKTMTIKTENVEAARHLKDQPRLFTRGRAPHSGYNTPETARTLQVPHHEPQLRGGTPRSEGSTSGGTSAHQQRLSHLPPEMADLQPDTEPPAQVPPSHPGFSRYSCMFG